MQTLYTIEDKETGGVKTLLHVSSYTSSGLAVIIYTSDEWGNHIKTVRKFFTGKVDILYHTALRKQVKAEGGIIHKRVSDTPLQRSKQSESKYPNRDSKGRFKKVRKK
jgi:hypothetical protein